MGANPFYEADPVTLGLGFGFRQVTTADDIVGAARLGPIVRAGVGISDVLNFTAPDSDEQERLRRRAVPLLPNEPEVLSLLSWTLLRRNKAGESLPLALRAANAAPENAAIADICAMVLLATGHCSAAMTSARRALSLAREATPTVRERAARDLSHIMAACKS